MKAINTDLEIINYNKKFGVVTTQQVIINNGKHQNKIFFESISRVNLIKSRVFYSNILFFAFSIVFITPLFLFQNINLMQKGIAITLAVFSLVFAALHKFYFYKIVIKLKNDEHYDLNATQFHRDCIKDFYFSILKRVRKDNQDLFKIHSA